MLTRHGIPPTKSHKGETSERSSFQERAMKYGIPTSMTDRSANEKITFSPIRKDIMVKFEDYFNVRVTDYTGVDHEMHSIIARWYCYPHHEVPLQTLMNKKYIMRLPDSLETSRGKEW